MQQNAFVQSMKTIAQSAITKAGFDKTRNGQIVGVNTVTNTYSIKVDGIIYNNVKVVNGMEYNKGDIVKVNIPMNNPSQAYISSSVLSDDSIGSKIATTQRLIDEVNKKADSIIVVMGRVYQLSINISYEPYIDPSDTKQYWRNIYTAVLTQDGTDVTSEYSSGEFDWYLEQPNGNTVIPGSPAKTIQLSTKDYLYGQSVMLEWRHTYTDEETQEQKEIVLRSRVTLFDNGSISNVAKYTTEINSGGVFVHRADGNYDVGVDWQSIWAYGVKIADTIDIIKAGQVWGSFGGSYLTIGRTSGNNFNIYANTNSSNGSLQFRYNSTVLTEIKNGSILLGRTASNYYNVYMDTQHLYFRLGSTVLTDITGSSITLGKTAIGNYNTYITNSGIQLRYATSDSVFRTILSLNTSGIQLYNSSNTRIASFASNDIIMGDTSNYIKITNSTMEFTKTSIHVGSLQYNKYKDNNNIYGLTLYLKRATTTQKPAYVGFTAQDSSDNSIFRWIYVQDNASITGYTSGALNAGANVDMNYNHLIDVNTIQGSGTTLTFYSSYLAGFSHRLLIGGTDYGYTFNVAGTAYISGNTHVGRLYLYDYTEASSKTANARLTTGSYPARLCFVNSSSRRYKHDIEPINNSDIDPHLLYNIEVVQFKFNNDYLAKDDQRYGIDVPGFIAENIAEKYPIAADINDDGTVEDWNDRFLIPPMLKLIQEQKQMIDDLERRLSQLERKE